MKKNYNTAEKNELIISQEPVIQKMVQRRFLSYSPDDREDFIQEGLIGVWKALDNYDDSLSSLSTYACMVAYRRILDYIIKNKHHNSKRVVTNFNSEENDDFFSNIADTTNVEETVILLETLRELKRIVESPSSKRYERLGAAAMLAPLTGTSDIELANRYGCGIKNIAYSRNRLRKELRDKAA